MNNYYDSDLVIIKEMLILKNEGKLQDDRRLRRKSTFSLINDKIRQKKNNSEIDTTVTLRESERQKHQKNKMVYLNFKEFCMIKFNYRPQIIRDFFSYASAYDMLYEQGLVIPRSLHTYRSSENIVIDMNISPDFHEIIRKNDKYDYYCSLDTAMSLYDKPILDDLFKKFKYLQSNDKLKFKVITRESMILKLVICIQPDLLGYRNDYFSERFYEYLSEGKNLTKAKFLMRLGPLFKESSDYLVNKLAFELYDVRNDNIITVDEAYHMFETLPIGSAAYIECHKYFILRMIDLFIDSIFDRRTWKITGINFSDFSDLVDVSCIGFEIFEMLKTSFEALMGRQNIYFQTQNVSSNEVDKHLQTKSSLFKMVNEIER